MNPVRLFVVAPFKHNLISRAYVTAGQGVCPALVKGTLRSSPIGLRVSAATECQRLVREEVEGVLHKDKYNVPIKLDRGEPLPVYKGGVDEDVRLVWNDEPPMTGREFRNYILGSLLVLGVIITVVRLLVEALM